jgi:peptidoglycan/xylan/chitin deacetylase (PgdA/CDA1 family)
MMTTRKGVSAFGRRAAKVAVSRMLPKGILVLYGSRNSNRIAITFDDGPDRHTHRYLEILDEYGVFATFFVVGRSCLDYRDELGEMAVRGHELGVHGFTHEIFPAMESAALELELSRTHTLLPKSGSVRKLVRPPRGAVSLRSLIVCANAGFQTVLWSRDSRDWALDSAGAIARELVDRPMRHGDIALFHEGQPRTLEALPRVLETHLAAGYEFATISQLLGD